MKKVMIACACAAVLAACGGDNNGEGTNNGTAATNNDTSAATNNDTSTATNNDTTTTNNDTTTTNNDTTTTNNDTATTNNDTTTTNNDTTTTNNGTTGDRLEAHGCTFDTAMDQTGKATVNVSDIEDWVLPHNLCLVVSTGTVVNWTGNLSTHPLVGGVDGAANATSPITIAAQGATGQATVDVTFDTAGDYPYYCGVHVAQMNGVVYVVD